MQTPNSPINPQTDWLEKTRGNLVVAATVIGGMGFQLMINPPGGVRQSEECSEDGSFCLVAGTSILADYPNQPYYVGMYTSSIVSFSASMCLILLIASGLGLGNRFIMGIMKLLMMVAVLCVSAAFYFAMLMVYPTLREHFYIQLAYFGIWALLAVVIFVAYGFRLIFPKPA